MGIGVQGTCSDADIQVSVVHMSDKLSFVSDLESSCLLAALIKLWFTNLLVYTGGKDTDPSHLLTSEFYLCFLCNVNYVLC